MATTPKRPARDERGAPRIRLRASHSARIRLSVSHRPASSWNPPGKDSDTVVDPTRVRR